jgi:hypothetical protein
MSTLTPMAAPGGGKPQLNPLVVAKLCISYLLSPDKMPGKEGKNKIFPVNTFILAQAAKRTENFFDRTLFNALTQGREVAWSQARLQKELARVNAELLQLKISQ